MLMDNAEYGDISLHSAGPFTRVRNGKFPVDV